MKTLWKILKGAALLIGGGIVGYFGCVVTHLKAWHVDRDAVIEIYDNSDEYWRNMGIWKD